MTQQDLRDAWYKNPSWKFNVSTKLRKEMMLDDNLRIVYEGKSYAIKFKNLGGGVWEAYTEMMFPAKTKNS